MPTDDIRRFMIRWNNKFPVDRWWRQKHNIPFLSERHREQSFLSQVMEYEEELMFQERQEKKEDINSIENYIPNVGDFFKTPIVKEVNSSQPMSAAEIEEFRREAALLNEQENGSGEEDKDIS
jgi:hypothetical protein